MTQTNGIHLQGAKELQKIMLALGGKIAKRAASTGVRRGAMIMKQALAAASPVQTGTLKKEWRVKKLRSQRRAPSAAYVVNIRARHFYEVLEFSSARGKPMNPFAEKTMMAAKARAMATIVAATRKALAEEAGRAYQKSKRLGQ